LYEAFSLAFLSKLDRASHPVIRDLISKDPGSQIAYQTFKQKVQQCKLEGFKERPAQMAWQEFEMQGKVGRRQIDIRTEQEERLLCCRAHYQFGKVLSTFVLEAGKYPENVLEESLELLTTTCAVIENIVVESPLIQNVIKVSSRLQ
jgi:hypothetical protein